MGGLSLMSSEENVEVVRGENYKRCVNRLELIHSKTTDQQISEAMVFAVLELADAIRTLND
jgi:hypothetical protein